MRRGVRCQRNPLTDYQTVKIKIKELSNPTLSLTVTNNQTILVRKSNYGVGHLFSLKLLGTYSSCYYVERRLSFQFVHLPAIHDRSLGINVAVIDSIATSVQQPRSFHTNEWWSMPPQPV